MKIVTHSGTMDCGVRAFNAGLKFAGLPPTSKSLMYEDEILDAARSYGLTVVNEPWAYLSESNKAVLVGYKTGEYMGHLIFCSDIALFVGKDVNFIVAGWEELAVNRVQ